MIRFDFMRPAVAGAVLLLAGSALAETPTAAPTEAPVQVQETGAQTPPESAACPPQEVLAAGRDDLLKFAGMAREGLVTTANMIRQNEELAGKMAKALKDMGYDAACYAATMADARSLAEEQGEGAGGEGAAMTAVSRAMAEACAKADFDGVKACLTDLGSFTEEELFPGALRIRVLDEIPPRGADYDATQTEELLRLIKAQVDAGNISGSEQTALVNRLMQ